MLVTATLITALFVTACSGEAGAEDERVTLASLLGVSSTGTAQFYAQQVKKEELIATCMIDAGWEYIPRTLPELDVNGMLSAEEEEAGIKDSGLGFAASFLGDETGLAGVDDPWDGFVDPNTRYVDSLSGDEKVAYEETLYGTAEQQAATMTTSTQFDPATGDQFSFTRSQSGCQGEADIAISAGQTSQTPAQVTEIMRYWSELQERVDADPQSIALDERWSSCMYAAGYDYSSPEDYGSATYFEFSGRVREVTGEYPAPDPLEGWTQEETDEFFATASDDEVEALVNTPPDVTEQQRRQLEQIFADEVALGLQNLLCTRALKDDAAEIYGGVEELYALEHEDELAALAASLGSSE